MAYVELTFGYDVGAMAMPRSPVLDHYEPQPEHYIEDDTGVDASMLPPG
jgi:acetolactate synthase-1/3 small subunit